MFKNKIFTYLLPIALKIIIIKPILKYGFLGDFWRGFRSHPPSSYNLNTESPTKTKPPLLHG